MALQPYPTSLAAEDWLVVEGLVTGTVPDPRKAVHCGWDAIGFALGQAYPDTVAMTGQPAPSLTHPLAMTKDGAATHVRALAAGQPLSLGASGWLGLAQLLLQLVSGLLAAS